MSWTQDDLEIFDSNHDANEELYDIELEIFDSNHDANEELYDIEFWDDFDSDDEAYARAEDFYGLPPYYDLPENWEEM